MHTGPGCAAKAASTVWLGGVAIEDTAALARGQGWLENTLSGAGSLVKTGTGELTLSGDNTYSGGTTISDGTLIAASVNALGSVGISHSALLHLGEGELENTPSGSCSLVNTGTGELTISADNPYSRGTTISVLSP
ncbi:autotransporter-associated beta strand repeat-containing protein, partial [Salmonella enterica]|uniref:autotransporter-associated beta strand repeat-containing protein n=1 Tax=Salmonella enterica TaxID=28901 RepID=UPI0032B0009D